MALVVQDGDTRSREVDDVAEEPYCFVLMPFGRRPDRAGGALIDFDRLYHDALVPAIRAAGLHPYRDDATAVGGIVQKRIYEALLLCDFAIADLTVENSNVFYELGVRHAARPSSTLAISANVDSIPFDVAHLRTLRYRLDEHNCLDDHLAAEFRASVTDALRDLRQQVGRGLDFADSPLFQLVEGWRPVRPESLKTDLFAERVAYNEALKERLGLARAGNLAGGPARDAAWVEVAEVRAAIGAPDRAEAGLLVDLLLTYRAFEAWDAMCGLVEEMPGLLRHRTLVQEQLAFALNRRAESTGEQDRVRAVHVLDALVQDGRASSETYGLLGRVHKDRWRRSRDQRGRRPHLRRAIEAYAHGFRLDPTDPFPGVNAATLLRISGSEQDLRDLAHLLPVLQYAAERLLAFEKPTYWMHATLLEIALLRGHLEEAHVHLERAVDAVREPWEPLSTLQNVRDLIEAGAVPSDSVDAVVAELEEARRVATAQAQSATGAPAS